jgi:hypothetical protein
MDELLQCGAVGRDCNALGAVHVHSLKGVFAMFAAQTDRIHHTACTGNRIGHRLFVMNVGGDRFQARIIDTEQRSTLIRVPRYDPHRESVLVQTANDAPAEETGSTENSDHGRSHVVIFLRYLIAGDATSSDHYTGFVVGLFDVGGPR